MRGRAARFAYSPLVLVAYLDEHTTYALEDSRRKRFINGHTLDQDTGARIIRRWRSGSYEGVTKAAAERMLSSVGLSLASFEDWAAAHHHTAIIRGTHTH